jgi:hypothetical protein
MEPFKVAAPLRAICDHYPTAVSIREVASAGGEQARIALARLWLSEGIPFAFKECPGVYESVRTWLSGRLEVEPKEINITGSARLGQSLISNQIGKPFDPNSDLDIFIVSKTLFEKLRNDFNKWSYEFESGKVKASSKRESDFWKDNNSRGPKLLLRGFIDSWMIPNLESYTITKNISQTMWLLKEKLRITLHAPKIAKASVRCYQSWEAYVRQTVLNLAQ